MAVQVMIKNGQLRVGLGSLPMPHPLPHPQQYFCRECGAPCDPIWNITYGVLISPCCNDICYEDDPEPADGEEQRYQRAFPGGCEDYEL